MSVPSAQKSSRLFENDFFERLTHVHHRTPFFIFVPLVFALILYAVLKTSLPGLAVPLLFAAGLLEWTWFEYMLHRYVFHYEPKSAWGKRMIHLFHGIHHDFPNEADRLVMPPATSIPIAAVFLMIHYAVFGNAGLPLFAGFLAGYLYYEHVHYSVHNSKRKFGWTEKQRKEHLLHHFQHADYRFGVTSPLWDYVFRTHLPPQN